MKITAFITSLLTLANPSSSRGDDGPIRKRSTRSSMGNPMPVQSKISEVDTFGRLVEEVVDDMSWLQALPHSMSYSMSYGYETETPSMAFSMSYETEAPNHPIIATHAPSQDQNASYVPSINPTAKEYALSSEPTLSPTLYSSSNNNLPTQIKAESYPTSSPTPYENGSDYSTSPTQKLDTTPLSTHSPSQLNSTSPTQTQTNIDSTAPPTHSPSKLSSMPPTQINSASPTQTISMLPTTETIPTSSPTVYDQGSNDSTSPTKSPTFSGIANNTLPADQVDVIEEDSGSNGEIGSSILPIIAAGFVASGFIVGFAVRAIDRRNGPTEYLNLDGDSHSSFSLQA